MNIFKTDDYFGQGDLIYISPVLSSLIEEQPHMHEFLELVYIYSGSGCHCIDGQAFEVARGDLVFINLNQTHAILSGEMQYINCLLRPEFLSELLTDQRSSEVLLSLALFDGYDQEFDHSQCVIRFRGEDLLEMQSLFRFLVREAEQKQKGYQAVLGGYMRVLFTKMVRALETGNRSAASEKLSLEIIQYVNEHCCDQLSLRQLAEKYFYHPSYLSTKFKEASGKSLSAYIKEKRMEAAARLLTDTDMPVEKICLAVGYQEKGHFYTAFKGYTGQTPSQYRSRKSLNT